MSRLFLVSCIIMVNCRREHTRSRSNSVDTNALADVLVAETSGEGHNGALCRGVVEKIGSADVGVDGSVVDDGGAGLHVGERVLGDVEERVNVDVEGVYPLLLREVLDILDHHLICNGC